MISIVISNSVILNIYNADSCCILFGNSKSEAINLLRNFDLCTTVDLCKI